MEQPKTEPVARVPSESPSLSNPEDADVRRNESGVVGEPADQGVEDAKSAEGESKRTVRGGNEPFEMWEREEMEKLLMQLRGHLGMQRHRTKRVNRLKVTSHLSKPIFGG